MMSEKCGSFCIPFIPIAAVLSMLHAPGLVGVVGPAFAVDAKPSVISVTTNAIGFVHTSISFDSSFTNCTQTAHLPG